MLADDNFTILRSYFSSAFNCLLGDSLHNCTSLTHIYFGYNFDNPLGNALDNCTALTHIKFGDNFNQPLVNSLDNCTALTHIKFGYYFKRKCELLHNVRSLRLYYNNTYLIDYLPDAIEELELGVS